MRGGIGIGAFKDYSVIHTFNALTKRINPNKDHAPRYDKLFPLFNNAYNALCDVFKGLAEYNRKEPFQNP